MKEILFIVAKAIFYGVVGGFIGGTIYIVLFKRSY
jgi:hypothetical protein